MTTDLTPTLTALLDQWDKRAAEAARKLEASGQPVQGAFYAGVMFGMETARDGFDCLSTLWCYNQGK